MGLEITPFQPVSLWFCVCDTHPEIEAIHPSIHRQPIISKPVEGEVQAGNPELFFPGPLPQALTGDPEVL